MRNSINTYRQRWRLATLLTIGVALPASDSWAFDVFWTGGASAWATSSDPNTPNANWDSGFAPAASFEEVGIINNGGVASLSVTAPDAAGLVLGQLAGDSGTLIVQSGGSLTLVETNGSASAVAPLGIANIGLAGDALLEVHGGGTFSTTSLDINPAGTVRIGTSGAGAATVSSTGSLFSAGLLQIRGSGHALSVAGNAALEGGGQFAPIFTSSMHSPIEVVGNATLGGVLRPQVSGYAPTAGDRWDLIDAAAITGSFSALDFSALPSLPTAQVYRTFLTAGGNGEVLQFGVDQVLSLTVGSGGGITLANQGTAPIEIDGYSILANLGGLVPAAFNGLADQNVGGANVWQEAGLTASSLSELSPTGSLTLGAGQSYSLGAAYSPAPPTAFGIAPEELVFQYSTPSGDTTAGIVVYAGGSRRNNNLLLTVDPTTGEAQLKNDSTFTIELEGYSILSGSGALLTGSWSSLDDQGVTGWEESNPTATALNELLPVGTLTLTSGAAYNLGDLFNSAGELDLALEFLLAGDAAPSTGVVVYGAIPASIPGDYNNDGFVNAADYTVWRDGNSPDSSPAGYNLWANNYGATASTSSALAVPEPTTACLIGLAISCFVARGRRQD
ncbi:hypothetical protein Pla108_41630 [Botrimarina colliarenosi]|uniref:Autotransporter-associated beta strand repeat protein n=1 Tax=Botrimarina colliarenosi TaxID=2528001 RepID=A0A5C5ZXY7_9BACT|nr:hypothetical protein [Botrimarina colliarenosi]TWT92020.1 hypothetical protein Pla108_41630 [Botrimarina colliarenosi]